MEVLQVEQYNTVEQDGASLVELKETRTDTRKTQQQCLFSETMTRFLNVILEELLPPCLTR